MKPETQQSDSASGPEKVLRGAVIGTGMIARQHLGAVARLPWVKMVGVADLSRTSAECTAERFGVAGVYTDSKRMIEELQPDVVHITTPPDSHFRLAEMAVQAGCHVIVEKPVTTRLADLETLLSLGRQRGVGVVEDLNYLFNGTALAAQSMLSSGELGRLVHVEVVLALDLLSPGHPFSDKHVRHPVLRLRGGAIHDFLPHLASLVTCFAGETMGVCADWLKTTDSVLPFEELRAMVKCREATASILFTAQGQPDTFYVRLHGTRARVTAGLFEPLFRAERVRGGPKPLMPVANAFAEGWTGVCGAINGLRRKLSPGPGAYEGLHRLVADTYTAIRLGRDLPVSEDLMMQTSSLVARIADTVPDVLPGAVGTARSQLPEVTHVR